MNDKDILICGAGIGGLALAIAINDSGKSLSIIDKTEEFKHVGAGVNILPHAMHILDKFELADRVAEKANEIDQLSFLTSEGYKIHSEPRGRKAGYRIPQFAIHRGELHNVLLHKLEVELGLEVNRGYALHDFCQTECSAQVNLCQPRFTDTSSFSFSALVGCDGIHSKVRSSLYPDEGDPIQSGVEMWRGISANTNFNLKNDMFLIGSLDDLKLVIYSIGRHDGKELINWVLERKQKAKALINADWTRVAQREHVIEVCQSSKIQCVDLVKLINKTESIHYFQMVDRDPLTKWGEANVTLLGDAAHPMYPFGSNGACQAILDAGSLAGHLSNTKSVPGAFAAYERERRPITSKIVELNRKLPPDSILEIAHKRLNGRNNIEPQNAVSKDEIESISERYKEVAGFSISQLNDDIRPDAVEAENVDEVVG